MRCHKRIILLAVCIVVTSLLLPTTSAGLLHFREVTGSLIVQSDTNISLMVVDVWIFLREEYSVGYGNFTLYNRDNETASFTLGFDPGGSIDTAAAKVDNSSVPLRWNRLDNTEMPVFDTSIEAMSFQNVSVSWMARSKYWDYSRNPFISGVEAWEARYDIIGTRAWPDGIENVTVRFVTDCEGFRDPRSPVPPTQRFLDDNGREVLLFERGGQFTEIGLVVTGDTIEVWDRWCFLGLLIAALVGLAVVRIRRTHTSGKRFFGR